MIEQAPRPVVYLNVDDVLIRWEGRTRSPAPGVADFLVWLQRHHEVRWLTSWCPSGIMRPDRVSKLARLLEVREDQLQRIRNPRAFPAQPFGRPSKHLGIDWQDERPWVWIEDESLHVHNLDVLEQRGVRDRYIECNTSRRPDDLARVQEILGERFGKP